MKKKARVHRLPTEDSILGQLVKCIDGGTPKTKVGEFAINLVPRATSERVKWGHYHLYITTDEEIKEGDYYYDDCDEAIYQKGELDEIEIKDGHVSKSYHKIIATTDPKLENDYGVLPKPVKLPAIPQSFIEEYCKAGGIDEVLVEYDSYLNIPVETSVKFNDWLPSTLKEYQGLEGQVIWGVKDKIDFGSHCIKVEFLNRYNKKCELYGGVSHWHESIKHLYYHKISTDSNNCIIIHPVEEKMYSREEVGSKIKEFVKEYAYEWDMDDINEWIEENL